MTAIVLKQDPNTEKFKKKNAIYYDNTQRTLLRFVRIDSVFCCCCFLLLLFLFVCLLFNLLCVRIKHSHLSVGHETYRYK